jgi:hypothetical protein
MTTSKAFSELCLRLLNQRGTTAGRVAEAIGLSRATLYNWRDGKHQPAPHHRDKVLACGRFLRLDEAETNALLRAAGMSEEFPLHAEPPRPSQDGFIARLFDELAADRGHPLLLLSRAGWGEPPFREALLAHARRLYRPPRVLHLQPPYAADVDAGFATMARRAGIEGVRDSYELELALEERVQYDDLFLLVSRFDQGEPDFQERLAGILRSLCEIHAPRLRLVICGGERLAGLKYQSGDLSLLNIAEVMHWPDLTAEDIPALYGPRHAGLKLSRPQIEGLIRITGADPQLLDTSLRLVAREPDLDLGALPGRLANHDILWARYTPLINTEAHRERLRELLAMDTVAEAQPFLIEPVLRRLYWSNLVRERPGTAQPVIGWLCEAARLAGQRILAAAAGAHPDPDGSASASTATWTVVAE